MIIERKEFRLSLFFEVTVNEEAEVLFHLVQNTRERRRILREVPASRYNTLRGYPETSFVLFQHRLLYAPLVVTSENSDTSFRTYLIQHLRTTGSPLIDYIDSPAYVAFINNL